MVDHITLCTVSLWALISHGDDGSRNISFLLIFLDQDPKSDGLDIHHADPRSENIEVGKRGIGGYEPF